MKISEQDLIYQRQLIWNNLDKINNENNENFINRQKKFINNTNLNNTNLNNKNKHKSINILNTYLNSKDKDLTEQIFWNTVKNKITI